MVSFTNFLSQMTAVSSVKMAYVVIRTSAFRLTFLLLILSVVCCSPAMASNTGTIHLDASRKLVTISDGNEQLQLQLSYDNCCILNKVVVRGREVIAESGVTSGINVNGKWFTTASGIASPRVEVSRQVVTLSGIIYGKPGREVVSETWRFKVLPDRIEWRIKRRLSEPITLNDAGFPQWNFKNMTTWTGGLLNNGGVVWNKYLETADATYGAHASAVTFWNKEHNDCLRISSSHPLDGSEALRFSHQKGDVFSMNYVSANTAIAPKHNLNRYLSDRQDLWAPFKAGTAETTSDFTLKALNYDEVYNCGKLQGLKEKSIRELMNTVARYGVIDRNLVGGNGWRSGYICLHEQWFAQIGAALGETDYIDNYSNALDYYKDHAIEPDGRVESRWCYNAGDAMPGTYNSSGFYEAQWGYLLDSQPDYVIDVAGQFNLTGNRKWLAGQKSACEKVLQYLMNREIGKSGLVAMIPDSEKDQKSSDWIDIIWASYKNALVNAELYHALELWANAEDELKDSNQAAIYREFALRLKASFNSPISEGGFWDPVNQWYVYWLDKDGSVHGNNLVTPVNFAAIGYGLCDDSSRKKAILDRIEVEMQKENLFIWPLNFFSYEPIESSTNNFPFPNYENGDIFLSWGELGVRAYASYNPEIALKYIQNTLNRYDEDGLSFQRYLRASQQGAGDDILAGNCMPIVGLYRDIYGIQPQPNRLYLEPHLTASLDGTELRYELRGVHYTIGLKANSNSISAGDCTMSDSRPFAVNSDGDRIEYFAGKNTDWGLEILPISGGKVALRIKKWLDGPSGTRSWSQTASRTNPRLGYVIKQLKPLANYMLKVDGIEFKLFRADKKGQIKFEYQSQKGSEQLEIVRNG